MTLLTRWRRWWTGYGPTIPEAMRGIVAAPGHTSGIHQRPEHAQIHGRHRLFNPRVVDVVRARAKERV